MKRSFLISLILFLPVLAFAQGPDSIDVIKIKRRIERERTEGIATIAGMYYGKIQIDSFLQCRQIKITQDSGKLQVVSFEAWYSDKGKLVSVKGNSAELPQGLKEAISKGGSLITIENIKAQYKNGTTVTLNPIILRIYDISSGPGMDQNQSGQAEQKGFATVAGMSYGQMPADSLLKYDYIELTGAEKNTTIKAFDITYVYRGQAITLHNNSWKLNSSTKDLIRQTAAVAQSITFENIKAANNKGETIILNPVIIRLTN